MEALSRGARKAVMVEKSGVCLRAIEKNIERLGFKDRALALKADVLSGLVWLMHYCDYEGYDIVFVGAPYRNEENLPVEYSSPTINIIFRDNIMPKSGVIVCQHHKKEKIALGKEGRICKTCFFGDTVVDFIRSRNEK